MTTHTPHDSGIETQAAGDVRLTTLLLARYGATAPNLDVWNETLKTVLGHRSVRHYRPDPLPEGTIELLVAAGQSAASSSNLQAWSVIAVEDSNRKARLAALAGEQAPNSMPCVCCTDYPGPAVSGLAGGSSSTGNDWPS